ncbi:uncharacterized protein LOC143185259 [Calliopsis andreniformis]|uniref:uncharacterized protein LOC143185259 n=1 Tax=Calliopsis andreniformis TaxID=337506 RepID=UPI003FCDAE0D
MIVRERYAVFTHSHQRGTNAIRSPRRENVCHNFNPPEESQRTLAPIKDQWIAKGQRRGAFLVSTPVIERSFATVGDSFNLEHKKTLNVPLYHEAFCPCLHRQARPRATFSSIRRLVP